MGAGMSAPPPVPTTYLPPYHEPLPNPSLTLSRSFSLCSSLSPGHQPPKAVVFGVESGVAHADRDIPRVGVVIPICIFSHMCVCVPT